MPKIENGDQVTDQVTGFQGVVTGVAEYITGCRQCLVQPRVDEKGVAQDGRWFDDDRLALNGQRRIELKERKRDGCDAPAPIR